MCGTLYGRRGRLAGAALQTENSGGGMEFTWGGGESGWAALKVHVRV